ncbi:unnamed protein product [Sphagnum balticum]
MAVNLLLDESMYARVLIVFLIFFSFGNQITAATKPHILPFKVWKQKKIDEARAIEAELKYQSHKNLDDDAKQDLNQKISQAGLNVGVMKDLSANDYFLLYVAPQFKDNDEALIQAAKTLSPRDVVDILNAYQRKLQSPEVEPAPTPPEVLPSTTEKTAKAP